ncbi:S1 family peptidase [Janthinobacterium fluminis]|uniref:Serine protease n=1 Tax=Janthinobacterium fluminis TaxID=2987524 RepID=A0ABT5JVX6_9BURK|nr:serine protease [Janthinobacterium fluminis]MDC8756873.1 serine protease [Janthinobacterium fluminis]
MKTAAALLFLAAAAPAGADQLARVIESVKPSIVGIGSFQKTRSPALIFVGTGFVVGDGLTVLTAAHVVQKTLDIENRETLGILVGQGDTAQFRSGVVTAVDKEHDLAQLRVVGAALPALQLGDSAKVQEGQAMAFTGFPLGVILGLHHVTHRATVSAITPVIMPPQSAQKLDAKLLKPLQKPVYSVFQLDGTAYPGSSGSPLYDPDTGLVYGVINMVYVKGLKEAAISAPSGITYAIPGNFIRELLPRR